MIDYRHPNFTHFTNGRWATPPPRRGWIRVRVSIMGSTTDRNVGESQSFLVLIDPIISTAPVSTPRVDKLSRSHAPAPASARARCRRSRAPNAPAPPDTSPSAAGRAPTRARTAVVRPGRAGGRVWRPYFTSVTHNAAPTTRFASRHASTLSHPPARPCPGGCTAYADTGAGADNGIAKMSKHRGISASLPCYDQCRGVIAARPRTCSACSAEWSASQASPLFCVTMDFRMWICDLSFLGAASAYSSSTCRDKCSRRAWRVRRAGGRPNNHQLYVAPLPHCS
jgi:hypothetical protein